MKPNESGIFSIASKILGPKLELLIPTMRTLPIHSKYVMTQIENLIGIYLTQHRPSLVFVCTP